MAVTSMQNCAKGLLICVQCSGACMPCVQCQHGKSVRLYSIQTEEAGKGSPEMLCSHRPFAEKTITSSCTAETGSRMEQKKPLSRSLTKLVSIPNTETDGSRARTGLIKLELLIFDVLNFNISIARHIEKFFNFFPEISVFLFSYLMIFPVSRCLLESPEFSHKTRFARKSLKKLSWCTSYSQVPFITR